jgi:hypothetical protein
MQSNKLAEFFNKQREIIEAAETPFAKLAIFILPVLAPSVPATLTGLHIYKLLLEIFTFSFADALSKILAVIVSIVLELLGYVGAISFIQSVFRWIRYRKDEYLLPSALNGIAYIFYLVSMFLINVQLGRYFGTPDIMNNIVGLLSFVTVPTSLLAANHLSQKEEREETEKESEAARNERITKYKIKHGINPDTVFQQNVPQATPAETAHKASDYRDFVFELLDQSNGTIPLTAITDTVNKQKRVRFTHADVKGTWYKYQQAWLRSHPQ